MGQQTPEESMKAAKETESIINDKNWEKGGYVTSIDEAEARTETYGDSVDVGEGDEDEAAHLIAINCATKEKGMT